MTMTDNASDPTADDSDSTATTDTETTTLDDDTVGEAPLSDSPTEQSDSSDERPDPGPARAESTATWGDGTADDRDSTTVDSGFGPTVRRYLFWGTFGLLSVLAVVATAGLYMSASSAIDVWITDDYEPIFRALFNLVVVLVCAVGLSVLVRRIDVTEAT